MAITISGQNNNDKILASDGVLDSISGFNVVGVMTAITFDVTTKHTANHIDVGSSIQLGNAGIITATTLIGNVTGNVNSTSHLLLQISGSEKFRVGNGGQLGIGGANYGTSGQVLTSGGSGSAATWSTIASDKITEGNTEAEVIDTGSDGHFKVTTEGSERLRITQTGTVGIGSVTPANILDVQGSAHSKIHVGTTGTSHATGIQINHAKGNAALQEWQLQTDASADGNLLVRNATSGTSTMFFDADTNNVGINQTSPDRKLHVGGSFIRVDDGYGLDTSGATERVTLDNGFIALTTNSNERLRIKSDGKVGIGTNNPTKLLELFGTDPTIKLLDSSGDAYALIEGDSSDQGSIRFRADPQGAGSNTHIRFDTDGVQRLRVDSNGLGISSTTTTARNAGVGTAIGTIIFNSTANQLQVYSNDLAWLSFSPSIPTLTNISGTIYYGETSTLTLTGTDFLAANLQVNFIQATRSIDVTIAVTPSSNTSASVTIPASIYNNIQNGDVVTIKVTNNDGGTSNTLTTTAVGLPTGGTITTSGSYRIHTFTSSGNFVNTLSNLSVQYLVIAGGGGGGVANGGGGGGGAGGYRLNTGEMSGRRSSSEAAMTINTGTFAIVVGGGGAGNVHGGGSGSRGDAGTNSSFNSIVSNGGGYGGGDASRPGGPGGSGGAAARNNQSRGAGTAGQGGDGGRAGVNAGGGGGGAGELLGPDGVDSNNGGRGGNGLNSSITGTSVGRAGGGGGGSETPVNSSGGAASSGGGLGGCAGSIGRAPTAGTANTGGGGGGSGDYNTGGNHNGKAGGSGIVIIRYQV